MLAEDDLVADGAVAEQSAGSLDSSLYLLPQRGCEFCERYFPDDK